MNRKELKNGAIKQNIERKKPPHISLKNRIVLTYCFCKFSLSELNLKKKKDCAESRPKFINEVKKALKMDIISITP